MLDRTASGGGRERPLNTLSPRMLAFLVETNAYPTFVVDSHLSILHLNQDVTEAFNVKGGQRVRPGKPLEDYLPGESCEAIRAAIGQPEDVGGRGLERSISLDVTGKRYPVVVASIFIDSMDGKYPYNAFIVTLKMEGRRAKDQQSAKLASLGEFAAGIAHELNTPLASISLIAENLLEEVKEEAIKRELRKILIQVEFSAKTVQEILAFARKDNPTFELVDLRKVLNDSIESLRPERKYKLNIQSPQDLPKVKADPFQLHEVFINLIRNATEAMADGGEININILCNDGTIDVVIQDKGEGIPEENLSMVFQPFFTTKPHGQGVGLGLPICQRIITNHKGEILVNSKVGIGTTFTIRFPRSERA